MLVGWVGLEKIRNPDENGHPKNEKREEVYEKVVGHNVNSQKAYAPRSLETVTRVTKRCEHRHAAVRWPGGFD
jgi:hypothetical protein